MSTIFAEELIQSDNSIDIIVKGEAEKIMEDILNKSEKNQEFNGISEYHYKKRRKNN